MKVDIERMVGGGVGLAHVEGGTWMVAGALPGETVHAEPVHRRAGVVEAVTVALHSPPHPARVDDPCPHGAHCGGCDWPHVDPELGGTLKALAAAGGTWRRARLAEALTGAPMRTSPLSYRLRARLHWCPEQHVLGFYRRRSWQVVPIPQCRILSPLLMGHLVPLRDALSRHCPEPVDVEWLEELDGSRAVAALRGARRGPDRVDPSWVPTREELGEAVAGLHRLTTQGRIHTRWGSSTVTMRLPVPLEVPIGAFFQGNRHLVPWLFERIGELSAGHSGPLYDLHAGVGYLAAAADPSGFRPEAVLVEPFRPAARAAAQNLAHARVAVGRTAEAYLARHRRIDPDALVLADPPRAGMSAELRRRLAGWHPRSVLMLSCNPSTWARDTAVLLERGYALTHIELVDLFPSTHRVEVVSVLEAV